jgi:hypothetical protein
MAKKASGRAANLGAFLHPKKSSRGGKAPSSGSTQPNLVGVPGIVGMSPKPRSAAGKMPRAPKSL